MNFWEQEMHVMKYWQVEENPKQTLPHNFIGGFLEVNSAWNEVCMSEKLLTRRVVGTKLSFILLRTVVHMHTNISRFIPNYSHSSGCPLVYTKTRDTDIA